jgi:hypothetical protein
VLAWLHFLYYSSSQTVVHTFTGLHILCFNGSQARIGFGCIHFQVTV